MTWLFVSLLGLAAVLVVVGFMSKKRLQKPVPWSRWQFEDPDAVTWSDSYVALTRFLAFIGAGILVAAAFGLRADLTYNRSEVESAVDAAATDLSGGTGGDDSLLSPRKVVYDAVRKAGGRRLKIEPRGTDGSGGDRYEITNINGDHPFCLTAVFDLTPNGPQLNPTVTTGRC